MASENEPAKLLLPYLQRADELQKHEPLVAYYCRLYAMEKGLKIPTGERTKTTSALLVSLMKQLEKDKKSLTLGPEDNLHLEGFALSVFAKADKQDRAGRADLSTAKTFYAASIFFEILNQFGPLQPDLEQKQKYAVWKAADIRKAIKEGRKPTRGPPNGDDDLSVPSSSHSGSYDLGPNDLPVTSLRHDSDPSPQFHDEINNQHSPNIPPSPQFHDEINNQHSPNIPPSPQFHDEINNQHSPNIPPSPQFHDEINNQHSPNIPPSPQFRDDINNQHPNPSPQFHDKIDRQNSLDILPSPPSFPPGSYLSHDQSYPQEPQSDFHAPPPVSKSEYPTYSHSYHHQSYPQEPQPHLPHNYPSHGIPPYSLPNFQSYPSMSETSLPSAPSHYPSYYQGAETPYTPHAPPPTTSYPSTPQHSSTSRNETISEPAPAMPQKYQYDSNYEPPPDKIAEAHKAARFAVGALAFDDVSTAVEHLKKSLELLTNPSASQ